MITNYPALPKHINGIHWEFSKPFLNLSTYIFQGPHQRVSYQKTVHGLQLWVVAVTITSCFISYYGHHNV